MLQEGNVLLFTPFYFTDGGSSKDKYFIVLKSTTSGNILASLPTRKDNVPSDKDAKVGCISYTAQSDGFNFTCYRIEKEVEVIEGSDFVFPFPTHIYGASIKKLELSYFKLYPHEGVDYHIIGKLKKEIYDDLINCLTNSTEVKRGYRELLLN